MGKRFKYRFSLVSCLFGSVKLTKNVRKKITTFFKRRILIIL